VILENEKIKKINARQILDSRSNPTIEVDLITENNFVGRAAVPSGASTGINEAVELRDGDNKYYHGKGVLKALNNVKFIEKKIKGFNIFDQYHIDQTLIELDGTRNKSRLGANAILAVSLAVTKAAANSLNLPLFRYLNRNRDKYVLPVPLMNIINGGKHAGNKLSIQEFMIAPIGAKNIAQAIRISSEIYQTLKSQLVKKYGESAKNVGDEGGFAPPIKTTESVLQEIIKAIEETGYDTKKEVCLAIDAAASVFYENGLYCIDSKKMDTGQMIDFYKTLSNKYKIRSIEDPFEENQFQAFAQLTKEIGNKIQIVGDDIFVSDVERLSKGIEMGAANNLLLKLNQIGTLSEALKTAELALNNNYSVIVSHRSGETEDTTIADLVVALSVGQIKSGAPARSERTAKYNQLIRIEEQLGDKAIYPTGKLGFISYS
jgi:enolase